MQKPLRYLLLVGTLTTAGGAYAQTGSVGIGVAVPNSSAALDISSTTKGLLAPRMTLAQRDAIVSPAEGLLVYQTDNTPGIYQRTSAGWVRLVADNLGDHTATQNLNLNGKLLTGGTAATSGLAVDATGNVGVGATPGNKLDVAAAARTNTHASGRPLYVTGALTPSSGAEFRTSDATQGVGIGSTTIYAAGTSTNQDLNLQPKGTGSVGIGSTAPAASALLEVTSTTKGFLPPRMTQAQRNAISSPTEGLVIYQTDNTPGLYQRLSNGWASLGTFNTESLLSLAAPTSASTLAPGTTTVFYTDNSTANSNGVVTLGAGTEGQRLVIVNNDAQYLPVLSGSGTGNILPKYGARFIYTSGAWRRES